MTTNAAENATAGVPVVRGLEWRDLRPHSFPDMWSATSQCGVYDIEEQSASDSPVYVALGPHYAFIANKDSLDEAKAAAQTDYEQRIKSALNPDFLSALDTARAEIERLRSALKPFADGLDAYEKHCYDEMDWVPPPERFDDEQVDWLAPTGSAVNLFPLSALRTARATLSPAVKEPK